MSKFTKLKHDWTLIDDGVREMIDTHYYRIVPPKWSVTFSTPGDIRGEEFLDEAVRRAGEMLVGEILKNPFVKEAVDALADRARWQGYEGAYKEMRTGERYDFGGADNE